jgi:hypothetical protein
MKLFSSDAVNFIYTIKSALKIIFSKEIKSALFAEEESI